MKFFRKNKKSIPIPTPKEIKLINAKDLKSATNIIYKQQRRKELFSWRTIGQIIKYWWLKIIIIGIAISLYSHAEKIPIIGPQIKSFIDWFFKNIGNLAKDGIIKGWEWLKLTIISWFSK